MARSPEVKAQSNTPTRRTFLKDAGMFFVGAAAAGDAVRRTFTDLPRTNESYKMSKERAAIATEVTLGGVSMLGGVFFIFKHITDRPIPADNVPSLTPEERRKKFYIVDKSA